MRIADIAPQAASAEAELLAASAAYYQAADLATTLAEYAIATRRPADLTAAVNAAAVTVNRRREFDHVLARLRQEIANH